MGRKSYDRQFKMAAVKLVLEESVSEAAKELSVSLNCLYRWAIEYEEYGKVRLQVVEAHFIIHNMK